jgi:hypothetical protein
MKVISRIDAEALGLTRYFTGSPCPKGHIAERLVSNRGCISCSRQALAKYRVTNRTNLLERKRIAQNLYRMRNPDKVRATAKASNAKHRKTRNAEKAAWAKRNSGRVLAWARGRQLSKVQRTPAWLSTDDKWLIEEIYDLAALRTKYTGLAHHVDHILPLRGKTVSGLHVPSNLQVILGSENSRKGNRVAHA